MWGPSGSPFNLNFTVPIFNISWNPGPQTVGGITTLIGFDFGGTITANTWGNIGAEFSLTGFTSGTVAVDYPIKADISYPTSLSFEKGSAVTINTDYQVESGYNLETAYPSVGEAKLDFYFGLGMSAEVTLCIFSCVTFPIFPPINIPTTTLNIFTANAAGVTYLGPVCPLPAFDCDNCPVWCIPGTVEDPFLPVSIPDNSLGIGGDITLPYVETSDYEFDKCLYATGDSQYVQIELEILKFMGNFIPPPAGTVLSNLSNTFTLPDPFGSIYGASVSYNLFSASFILGNTNKQKFTFCPDVWLKMDLPEDVSYTVTDPANGNSVVSSGTSSSVTLQLGQDLNFDYLCDYDFIDVTTTYSLTNDFTNHTYDSLFFVFGMSALAVSIDLPELTVTPEICFPEICIPIPYPCPTWSNPFRWCTYTACTPAFCIPALVFPAFSFGLGPLWEHDIPLGAISPLTWYQNTWELEGFADVLGAPFRLEPRPYLAALAGTNVSCYGGGGAPDGAVVLTITNGTPPYMVDWSTGNIVSGNSNTFSQTGLIAGTYYAIITDANGCVTFAEQTIYEPTHPLSVDFTETDITCNGASDGSVVASVSGGTPGYTYSWSTGGSSITETGMPAGVYNLTVTDSKGCPIIATGSIAEPAALSIATIATNIGCFGDQTGAIDATVTGGTLPYTYLWSNGEVTQNIDSLLSGSYTFTVEDANACTLSSIVPVDQPTGAIALSAVPTDVLCFGDSAGQIDLTVSGGTAPYDYQWSNSGMLVLSDTTQDLSGKIADTYTVLVEDANSCSASLQIQIQQPLADLSVQFSVGDVSCFGGTDGQIDATVSGGTNPYTFNWSNGATSEDITGITSSSYQVTVTDANGCIITGSDEVDEPNSALALSLIETDILCFGDQTGAIELLAAGGTPPYNYNWSNGETTQNIDSLSSGTYSVTVTDTNSCAESISGQLEQPIAPIAISEIVQDVSCHGGNDGNIDVSVTGGTTPYSYTWSNPSLIILSDITQDLSSLEAGTYTVYVTDSNACNSSKAIIVNEPLVSLLLDTVVTHVLCYGNSTGAIDLLVSGGSTPYTYNWSNGSSSEDISSLNTGTYTVTVTDVKGCMDSVSVFVNQPYEPIVLSSVSSSVLCFGQNSGSIDLTVTGGTLPYNYNWSNGDTLQDLDSLVAGTYIVTVTDDYSCTANLSTNVDQPVASISLSAVPTEVSCYNGSDGSIDLTTSGGTSPYQYIWTNSSSLILNSISEDISSIPADTYLVVVTDSNNCYESLSVVVDQPNAPLEIQLVENDVNCFGGSDGSVDANISGGTSPYTYTWSSGQVTEDISNLSFGTYQLTVTDNKGCSNDKAVSVNQPLEALSVESTKQDILCFGASHGVIDLTTLGGTPPYTYQWSNGETSEDLDELTAGLYTVLVTDNNGCTFNSGAAIEQPDAELQISETITHVSCNGFSDAEISLQISGGTMPYSYQWGDTIYQLNDYSELLSGLIAGNYVFTIFDNNGCQELASFVVTEPQPLEVSWITSKITCFGGSDGSIDLFSGGGTVPYSFNWSNGSTDEDPNGLIAGSYVITVTDNNGCYKINTVNVDSETELVLGAIIDNVSCIDNKDGVVDLLVAGGAGFYTYSWMNGSQEDRLVDLYSGYYSVTVTDGNNCVKADTFYVGLEEHPCIEIPNSFTPNGDGKNDTWVLHHIDLYPSAKVQIYNRWGNLLYQTNGYYEPWDGLYNGLEMPAGTYYFIIDLVNGTKPYTGPLTIVR